VKHNSHGTMAKRTSMDTHLVPVRVGTHARTFKQKLTKWMRRNFESKDHWQMKVNTWPYFCASSLQISMNFDFDFDFPRIPSISCSVFFGSLGARRNEKIREGTRGTSQADWTARACPVPNVCVLACPRAAAGSRSATWHGGRISSS
jgi:hypothetical protein